MKDTQVKKTKLKVGRRSLLGGSGHSPTISIRVTPEQLEAFRRLGGSQAIRNFLDGYISKPEPDWLKEVRDLKFALEHMRGQIPAKDKETQSA